MIRKFQQAVNALAIVGVLISGATLGAHWFSLPRQETYTTGSRPACTNQNRSSFWQTQNTAGYDDLLQVCMQASDGTLNWITLVTGKNLGDSTRPALLGTAVAQRVASGQITTLAASHLIATGLSTVSSVQCTFDSDLQTSPIEVTCTTKNAPAGYVYVKTWGQPLGNALAVVPAKVFGIRVNWAAYGS